jgi:hypothetical protein
MDNVQKTSNCINMPSSQTFRSYSSIVARVFVTSKVFTEPLSRNVKGIFTEPLPGNDRGDTQTHTHTHTHTHTQTATWSHKPTLFFQNKESRLTNKRRLMKLPCCLCVCPCVSVSPPLQFFPFLCDTCHITRKQAISSSQNFLHLFDCADSNWLL